MKAPSAMGGRPPAGFTIIELTVVLVIIAGLFVMGTVVVGQVTRADLKGQAMRVAGTIKYTYAQAAIRQRYYRLVMNLDDSTYRVEMVEQDDVGGPPRIPARGVIGGPEGMESFGAPEKQQGYDKDDAEGSVFGLARPRYTEVKDMVVKTRKLKDGITFHSVLTPESEDPVTSGQTSITFFPNGFVERSMIVLTDGGAFLTLEVEPLSGKVYVVSGKGDASGDFFEVEEDD